MKNNFKIASWNVNSLRARIDHVTDWLQQHQPDILAIQETKAQDKDFPIEAIEAAGYKATFAGQKSYNGVALLSKESLSDVLTDVPGLDDPSRRILIATINNIRIINLYVVNGQAVDSEKYQHKLFWLEQVTRFIEAERSKHDNIVILGDFNIAPQDEDIHDPEAWHEKILCSTPERAALNKIMDLGFDDSFRLFEQEAESFSWWDYRAAGFRRNRGLRIDFILNSKTMSANCISSIIDKEPRKLERPSDHAPVVAEFDMQAKT